MCYAYNVLGTYFASIVSDVTSDVTVCLGTIIFIKFISYCEANWSHASLMTYVLLLNCD